MGLVLEWVYGTIVSTAEKARDSAKKPLGTLQPHMKAGALLPEYVNAARAKPAHASIVQASSQRRAMRRSHAHIMVSRSVCAVVVCECVSLDQRANPACSKLHNVFSQHRCDGAGRRQPSPEAAHDTLCAALQEQASWEQRAHVAKELLHEMLKSRREAADLQQQYDIKCGPSAAAASFMTPTALNCRLLFMPISCLPGP